MNEALNEFDRQLEHLKQKNYHALIGADIFADIFKPLRERVAHLEYRPPDLDVGMLPFVIVVNSERVPVEAMMERLEYQRKPGVIGMFPTEPKHFTPISSAIIPRSEVYLLLGIDRGSSTLDVAPNAALKMLWAQQRLPLTIAEGIALVTQFPDFLRKNNCFSLLASRSGDRRVPAIWISEQRAKLGWCWEGNPHAWLGSASAMARAEN
jgi:hypothetical protein